MTEQYLPAICPHIEYPSLRGCYARWLVKLVTVADKWIAHRQQRQLNRETVRDLSSLNDAALKDIGLSRGDVKWASHQPDSISTAVELEIIARRRSAEE